MVKITEIFYSIQGEIDVGKPAIFIRFSGCNLIACNKACDFCDSLYAEAQYKNMSIDEIVEEVKKYKCKNVVITGGEPLFHLNDLREVSMALRELNYNIDLETNGTLFDFDVIWNFDNINCSPKKQMINKEILLNIYKVNSRFKFVYENKDDLWWEVILKELKIEPEFVYIMPEGKTREEQLEKMSEIIEYCKKQGYNFTPRLQTIVWNNTQGV